MSPEPGSSAPPFFVVGAGRSGTTLLRVMLDRHPDVAIPPESHFIPYIWERRHRYGSDDRIERLEAFLGDLSAHHRFRSWEMPIDRIVDELANIPRPTLSQAVDAVFRAYARAMGKSRWGDKTPGYVEHVTLLAEIFPEARFVHLIRDGRDVALSVLDLHRLHRHPASAAYMWARQVGLGRRAGQRLGPGRYVEARYEHVLADLEGELRWLCDFLSLSFDPALLRHDEHSLERVPRRERRMHSRLALPPTKGLRDWRTQMDPRDVEDCEAVAGSQLAASGYELVTPRRLSAQARAWSRVVWFGIRSMQPRMRARRRARGRMRALRRAPGPVPDRDLPVHRQSAGGP